MNLLSQMEELQTFLTNNVDDILASIDAASKDPEILKKFQFSREEYNFAFVFAAFCLKDKQEIIDKQIVEIEAGKAWVNILQSRLDSLTVQLDTLRRETRGLIECYN